MRRIMLGIATAMLTIGSANAQTTTSQPASGTAAASGPASGTSAASGNDNQAVATTSANAPTPAHGHNSFTKGEADRRIVSRGFAMVHDLHKDNDGVWRGTATKDGAPTAVWLDYKGNVGNSANAE